MLSMPGSRPGGAGVEGWQLPLGCGTKSCRRLVHTSHFELYALYYYCTVGWVDFALL